ncbi:NADPH:quinone oxidoreductase family protein [Chachezhania sediminis]|uniref:NADPH:quinone oxidoreductase family protein n=1 Tax=Chachezhania sediminis TaxID=2599291 RepID=UPI00131B8A29|nr:NADPH:quinone oxidoreductase family protein [Chachezhania sediminis]
MRAYQIAERGATPGIVEVPDPKPGPGEVLIRLRATGLNFADTLMIRGTYQDIPEPPFTLGMEAAGEVLEVAPDVADLVPGDRVCVFAGQGGLAEMGAFPADRVVKIPDEMSFEHAAAFQIAYGTSHVALKGLARLAPGETLLVTGAAGGVGLTAVEIGAKLGARVVAQARGAQKLDIARAAGAESVIDGDDDLREKMKALGGADVVYETIGGDIFRAAFRSTNPGGRLIPIGFAGGEVPQIPANHLMVKNLTVIGFYIGGYMKVRPQVIRDSLTELMDWYVAGRLSPHVSSVLPLDEVATGLDLLRTRQATGKVVIVPG